VFQGRLRAIGELRYQDVATAYLVKEGCEEKRDFDIRKQRILVIAENDRTNRRTFLRNFIKQYSQSRNKLLSPNRKRSRNVTSPTYRMLLTAHVCVFINKYIFEMSK